MFTPNFTITPVLTKALMEIEACRQVVAELPVSVPLLDSLRDSARLLSTHLSTQIEGNRLTQSEVREVVLEGSTFPNRERDEQEVKNYFLALDFVDELANDERALTQRDIKTIHGLTFKGARTATRYRDGQNVIRNSATGAIAYMPPEAPDVSGLMKEFLAWINQQEQSQDLPAPLFAGLVHYQFATVHPYFDGNGRTARLLTNLVLHRSGYGLKGIYALEEYYARDLNGYYEALRIGPSHNYYDGRAEADLTPWLDYFCGGMAHAFSNIRATAQRASQEGGGDQASLLRTLDAKQKRVLSLFRRHESITTNEVAQFLGVHKRTALNHMTRWSEEGFVIQLGQAKKSRRYELDSKYRDLI